MATDLTDWSKDILLSIQGVPNPLIERAVRSAAIEFCEETLVWTESLTRISVVTDTAGYTLTPTSGRLIAVDEALYKADGEADTEFIPLEPVPQDQKDIFSTTGKAWKYETGTPSGYYHDEAITPINLYPIPDADSSSGLLVKVNLIPGDTDTTVEDFLFNMHRDALAAGALAYLLDMKDMPWHDEKKTLDKRGRFIEYMDATLRKLGRKYIPKRDKEARPKL